MGPGGASSATTARCPRSKAHRQTRGSAQRRGARRPRVSDRAVKRGELYRIRSPRGDPKRSRVYVVVSRQVALDSRFSTVICAPVYTTRYGIATQVRVEIGRASCREGG